jgi:mono/diheme cytochrome c family protein
MDKESVMKLLKIVVAIAVLAVLSGGLIIWSGLYNIAADDPHWPATYRLLEAARDRSIDSRASAIEVPSLDDPALIRSGAGNYNSMCVGCHLNPGAADTELSIGLYPTPPAWTELGTTDPREAFWVVKHGIKMSGMPAWGKSMDDQYIWGMVAFMQQFPGMSKAQYGELVASSGGHSHDGGETMPHKDSGDGVDHHSSDAGRSSFEPPEDPMADTAKQESEENHDHHH